MKKTYLTVLICCGFVFWCQAQPNLLPTNEVIINEFGTRQILISYATLLASTNALALGTNAFIGDKELSADQPNFWTICNTNGKGALFPEYNHRFAFELRTTNGIPIPKSAMGKRMSEPPKSLTDDKSGKSSLISNFPFGKFYDFPALTKLFNIPSNGVYTFELRCWSWQPSKKQYVLSDPIRVRVIAKTITSN
jgi:hypothetical protein